MTPYYGTGDSVPAVGSFTIGTLAQAAHVSVETVRYYERRGLLEQPVRGPGYRQYSDDDLRRLEFVRRAKDLGFTLAEIHDLLAATECRSVSDVLASARAKLVQVDDDLRALRMLRVRLSGLVRTCEEGDDGCVGLEVSGA